MSTINTVKATKEYYVEKLINGEYYKPQKWKISSIDDHLAVTEEEYDMIIYEPKCQLTLKVDNERKLKDLRDPTFNQKAMLWLILTHVKSGTLSYDEIARTFAFMKGIPEQHIKESRIRSCKHEMKRLLGDDLRDRIFGSQEYRGYLIKRVDWAFIWVRETKRVIIDNWF